MDANSGLHRRRNMSAKTEIIGYLEREKLFRERAASAQVGDVLQPFNVTWFHSTSLICEG